MDDVTKEKTLEKLVRLEEHLDLITRKEERLRGYKKTLRKKINKFKIQLGISTKKL